MDLLKRKRPGNLTKEAEGTMRADSRVLEDRAEIQQSLKVFRDQRSTVTLRFDGIATEYTARVLDILDKEFLLEDLSPRDGVTHIRAGKNFSLSGRNDGLYAFIQNTRIERVDAERGVPYYHVKLPKTLLVQHRRRAARYRLPLTVTTSGATISLFRNATVIGRIIDISAGGCRAEFEPNIEPVLTNDELIGQCAITISSFLEIHGTGVIRHLSHNKKHNKTVAGIELTTMNVTDRRRLEQFIQGLAKSSADT